MAVNYAHGKQAITHYSVIERFDGFSLLKLNLQTGRTHQIRVHLSHIGFPIIGDSVYGFKMTTIRERIKRPDPHLLDRMSRLENQLLHAKKLEFNHPSTGKALQFNAALPDNFKEILAILKK